MLVSVILEGEDDNDHDESYVGDDFDFDDDDDDIDSLWYQLDWQLPPLLETTHTREAYNVASKLPKAIRDDDSS